MVKRRIGIVVQRFGEEIIGGAERHARILADLLADQSSHEVVVLTTTATDSLTWKNVLNKGETLYGNINVQRFRIIWRSQLAFKIYKIIHRFLVLMPGMPRFLQVQSERIWTWLQGPVSPELIRHISKEKYDCLFFITYLYHPTQVGLLKAKCPAFLIPTAHPEEAFYFHATHQILQKATRILANTDSEARLIHDVCPEVIDKVQIVGIPVMVGLPVNPLPEELHGKKYVLYLGRVSSGKNVHMLIKWFKEWAHLENSDVQLALVGNADGSINLSHLPPCVSFFGTVNESEKATILRGAQVVCNPSAFESLSLIVLEGIVVEKPVIVNIESAVLRSYTEHYETVLGYSDFQSFCLAIKTALAGFDPEALARSKRKVDSILAEDVIRSKLAHLFSDTLLKTPRPS